MIIMSCVYAVVLGAVVATFVVYLDRKDVRDGQRAWEREAARAAEGHRPAG